MNSVSVLSIFVFYFQQLNGVSGSSATFSSKNSGEEAFIEWCESVHERRRLYQSECKGIPFAYPYPKCYCLHGIALIKKAQGPDHVTEIRVGKGGCISHQSHGPHNRTVELVPLQFRPGDAIIGLEIGKDEYKFVKLSAGAETPQRPELTLTSLILYNAEVIDTGEEVKGSALYCVQPIVNQDHLNQVRQAVVPANTWVWPNETCDGGNEVDLDIVQASWLATAETSNCVPMCPEYQSNRQHLPSIAINLATTARREGSTEFCIPMPHQLRDINRDLNERMLKHAIDRSFHGKLTHSTIKPKATYSFKLLQLLSRITSRFCRYAGVPLNFLSQAVAYFEVAHEGRGFYFNEDFSYREFMTISNLLRRCLFSLNDSVQFTSTGCPGRREVLQVHKRFGEKRPLYPSPGREHFDHHVVLDVPWNMVDLINVVCVDAFASSYRMYHKLEQGMEKLFTHELRFFWMFPEIPNFHYEFLFGPNWEVYARNLEKCVEAAYLLEPRMTRLQRPQWIPGHAGNSRGRGTAVDPVCRRRRTDLPVISSSYEIYCQRPSQGNASTHHKPGGETSPQTGPVIIDFPDQATQGSPNSAQHGSDTVVIDFPDDTSLTGTKNPTESHNIDTNDVLIDFPVRGSSGRVHSELGLEATETPKNRDGVFIDFPKQRKKDGPRSYWFDLPSATPTTGNAPTGNEIDAEDGRGDLRRPGRSRRSFPPFKSDSQPLQTANPALNRSHLHEKGKYLVLQPLYKLPGSSVQAPLRKGDKPTRYTWRQHAPYPAPAKRSHPRVYKTYKSSADVPRGHIQDPKHTSMSLPILHRVHLTTSRRAATARHVPKDRIYLAWRPRVKKTSGSGAAIVLDYPDAPAAPSKSDSGGGNVVLDYAQDADPLLSGNPVPKHEDKDPLLSGAPDKIPDEDPLVAACSDEATLGNSGESSSNGIIIDYPSDGNSAANNGGSETTKGSEGGGSHSNQAEKPDSADNAPLGSTTVSEPEKVNEGTQSDDALRECSSEENPDHKEHEQTPPDTNDDGGSNPAEHANADASGSQSSQPKTSQTPPGKQNTPVLDYPSVDEGAAEEIKSPRESQGMENGEDSGASLHQTDEDAKPESPADSPEGTEVSPAGQESPQAGAPVIDFPPENEPGVPTELFSGDGGSGSSANQPSGDAAKSDGNVFIGWPSNAPSKHNQQSPGAHHEAPLLDLQAEDGEHPSTQVKGEEGNSQEGLKPAILDFPEEDQDGGTKSDGPDHGESAPQAVVIDFPESGPPDKPNPSQPSRPDVPNHGTSDAGPVVIDFPDSGAPNQQNPTQPTHSGGPNHDASDAGPVVIDFPDAGSPGDGKPTKQDGSDASSKHNDSDEPSDTNPSQDSPDWHNAEECDSKEEHGRDVESDDDDSDQPTNKGQPTPTQQATPGQTTQSGASNAGASTGTVLDYPAEDKDQTQSIPELDYSNGNHAADKTHSSSEEHEGLPKAAEGTPSGGPSTSTADEGKVSGKGSGHSDGSSDAPVLDYPEYETQRASSNSKQDSEGENHLKDHAHPSPNAKPSGPDKVLLTWPSDKSARTSVRMKKFVIPSAETPRRSPEDISDVKLDWPPKPASSDVQLTWPQHEPSETLKRTGSLDQPLSGEPNGIKLDLPKGTKKPSVIGPPGVLIDLPMHHEKPPGTLPGALPGKPPTGVPATPPGKPPEPFSGPEGILLDLQIGISQPQLPDKPAPPGILLDLQKGNAQPPTGQNFPAPHGVLLDLPKNQENSRRLAEPQKSQHNAVVDQSDASAKDLFITWPLESKSQQKGSKESVFLSWPS